MNKKEREALLLKIALSLAESYVMESGLLEDSPGRYVRKLLPHANKIIELLEKEYNIAKS